MILDKFSHHLHALPTARSSIEEWVSMRLPNTKEPIVFIDLGRKILVRDKQPAKALSPIFKTE
jgi:hypothetical protein